MGERYFSVNKRTPTRDGGPGFEATSSSEQTNGQNVLVGFNHELVRYAINTREITLNLRDSKGLEHVLAYIGGEPVLLSDLAQGGQETYTFKVKDQGTVLTTEPNKDGKVTSLEYYEDGNVPKFYLETELIISLS